MNNSLSLYIHIPFCLQKCSYCDFLSFMGNAADMDRYCRALIKEIEAKGGHHVSTVFFGGGTPTCLSVKNLDNIMEAVNKSFTLTSDCEITVESNPETVDFEKLTTLKQMGFNRLSFGVQSLDDRLLKEINRAHTRNKFLESYENAVKSGFDNINLDLMFSLPGQSFGDFKASLIEAVALKPSHISCYSLILAEGTPLYEKNPNMPDENLDREMYHFAVDFLKQNGYPQYEISNFSKPDYRCAHNISYWDLTPYLGLGLGASSFINHIRYKNTDDFEEYIEDSSLGFFKKYEEEPVTDLMKEYMFLKFRMTEGVIFSDFHDLFGVCVYDIFGDEIKSLLGGGLLEKSENAIYLTKYGMDVANLVFAKFI